jgi:hypothetical protein
MQDMLAILITCLAAVFLMRCAWQHFTQRRSGNCGNCAGCPSSNSSHLQPLVTLSESLSHAEAQRHGENLRLRQ